MPHNNIKKVLLLSSAFLCFLFSKNNFSQNISGVINTYTPVTAINGCSINVLSSAGFNAGDKVLIIQMKGATIDITNSPAFGTILNYNNCGNYEINTISSITSNTIFLQFSLLRTYTITDMVQLIRIPVYNGATITGTLTAQTWDPVLKTGGVLAFIDNGTTTLNADIDVTGKGFNGTPSQTTGWQHCNANYIEPQTSIEAGKGENIAILQNMYTKGLASAANGGGGGLTDNGGGGASNFGSGGDGGRDGWQINVCGNRAQGGKALTYSNALNKIFMGGAGGDAQRSEGPGTNMGVNGGGIVIIRTNSLNGNGRNINALGADAANTIQDGGGGGGGGGTILIETNNYTSGITINTTGGKGGDAVIYQPVKCSGGGGGGGGILWTSTAALNANITYTSNGGLGGLSAPPAQNALPGQPGGSLTNLVIPESNLPLTLTLTVNASICNGNPYTLPDGSVVTTPGTYIDTISHSVGCDSIITTILTPNSAVTINTNAAICTGTSYTLPGGTIVNTAGTYHDTLTAANGCDSIINTILSVAPALTSSQNIVLCNGNSFVLPGGTSVSAAGTYLDTLTAQGGCDSIITTSISVNQNSVVSLNPIICQGAPYTLPNGVSVYTSGTYHDTLLASNGCDSIITITLLVNPLPAVSINGNTTIDVGQSSTLTANGGGTYNWSPSTGLNITSGATVIASPSETTTYCVEVTSSEGCKDTACIKIEVKCSSTNNFGIPNAFSPNNDGINDEFCLQGWDKCIIEFQVIIYDRWGEKVYLSDNPNFCWNGTYKNTIMDSQVFVYYIRAKYLESDKAIEKQGNISLIK